MFYYFIVYFLKQEIPNKARYNEKMSYENGSTTHFYVGMFFATVVFFSFMWTTFTK